MKLFVKNSDSFLPQPTDGFENLFVKIKHFVRKTIAATTSSKYYFKFSRKIVRLPSVTTENRTSDSIICPPTDYDEEILAGHSISLFFDGTETSATALSYTLYELARNPHCQAILYDEVRRVLEKHGGKLTYAALQEMTYLEGSFLESIRMNPPILHLGKLCIKPYTLPQTTKRTKPITISPGTTVYLPIHGIHMYVQFILE